MNRRHSRASAENAELAAADAVPHISGAIVVLDEIHNIHLSISIRHVEQIQEKSRGQPSQEQVEEVSL